LGLGLRVWGYMVWGVGVRVEAVGMSEKSVRNGEATQLGVNGPWFQGWRVQRFEARSRGVSHFGSRACRDGPPIWVS